MVVEIATHAPRRVLPTTDTRARRLVDDAFVVRALALACTVLAASCAPPYAVRPPPPGDDAGADEDAGGSPSDAGNAADAGTVVVVVDAGHAPSDAGSVDAGATMQEMRGLWITRFAYNSEASLEGILDRAANAGFNAVFVQIRGNGDAYYSSTLEPWAKGLTGVLGRDPGWDPLQTAVDHGHALGLEVHAYMNVFTGWPKGSLPVPQAEGAVQHPLYLHPEWLALDDDGVNNDSEYAWLSPANPAVRAHTVAVAREILAGYDIDGLHLDRVRTPGPQYSHDDVAMDELADAQAAAPSLTFAQFMDDAVTRTVADLYAATVEVRPAAALSAAVWGIHTPLAGCSTSEGKDDYHQDSWAWTQQGIIDALAPMTYWEIDDGACTDWAALTDGHVAASAPRHVWAGSHVLDGATFDFAQISDRIEYARAAGAQGTVLFASSYLDAQDAGTARWDGFTGTAADPGPFAQPAVVPALPWRP